MTDPTPEPGDTETEKERRERVLGRYDEEGYCHYCGEYVRDTAECARKDGYEA